MASTLEELLPILAQLSQARGERRSLAALAREAGRSPSYFQRAFSRVVGESPKQYTLRLQLECALVLLLTSDDSVLDIALAAGFESHEGFTRAFVRHFGQPPTQLRQQATASGLAGQLRHADILTHTGPCLRLFRAPLGTPTPQQGNNAVNYDITIQEIAETTFLYKAVRSTQADIAKAMGGALPAVFGYATRKGIEFTGPPTTLYVEWGPGMVTMWAGLPVKAGSEGEGEFEVATLPASKAAVTIHSGPYDGLGDAHAAVEQYLAANDLKGNGALREVYLTDPGEVPDPKDWKTQILWPVKG